jgi:hypothetical protein
MACRRCGKMNARRSRRRGVRERLLSLVGFYPYRCNGCDLRYYAWGAAQQQAPALPAKIEPRRDEEPATPA